MQPWFSYPTKPNEANIQDAVLVLKNLEDLPSCFDQLSLHLHSQTSWAREMGLLERHVRSSEEGHTAELSFQEHL